MPDQLGLIVGIVMYAMSAIALGVHCHANLRDDGDDNFFGLVLMWTLMIIWPLPIVLGAVWHFGRRWVKG